VQGHVLVFEPADMPAIRPRLVPLVDGADGKVNRLGLSRGMPGTPFRWPASEHPSAGRRRTPRLPGRIRDAQPVSPRPARRVARGSDTSIQMAIVRAHDPCDGRSTESLALLPQELGGGSITTISQGVRWISFTCASNPGPVIRAIVQAKDADVSRDLLELAQEGLDFLAKAESARDGPGLVHVDDP